MKKIEYLIIQSTETGIGIPVTKADIIDLHTSPVKEGGYGWKRPGFDYLIQPDGSLDTLISENNTTPVDLWGVSEGTEGILGTCKHIAYVGGKTEKETKVKDTRTTAQQAALDHIVKFYLLKFPNLQILGWDEVPGKEGSGNPGFAVNKWLDSIGVDPRNIYKALQVQLDNS